MDRSETNGENSMMILYRLKQMLELFGWEKIHNEVQIKVDICRQWLDIQSRKTQTQSEMIRI